MFVCLLLTVKVNNGAKRWHAVLQSHAGDNLSVRRGACRTISERRERIFQDAKRDLRRTYECSGEIYAVRLQHTHTLHHQEGSELRQDDATHRVTTAVGGDGLQVTETDLKGQPVSLSLTWLCRLSGIRADGVGARGSHGWLPTL